MERIGDLTIEKILLIQKDVENDKQYPNKLAINKDEIFDTEKIGRAHV